MKLYAYLIYGTLFYSQESALMFGKRIPEKDMVVEQKDDIKRRLNIL